MVRTRSHPPGEQKSNEVDQDTNPTMPMRIGRFNIINLGKVDKRSKFTKGENTYPIGFKSEITYASYVIPNTDTTYTKYVTNEWCSYS
jgi:hypothetical protein